jgi:type II secretory pathway component GspD/PulD (secretin)
VVTANPVVQVEEMVQEVPSDVPEEVPAVEEVAEVEPAPQAEVISEPAPEVELVDDLSMGTIDEEVASASDDLISVRLSKVGLEEAINLFAQLSGANIIVPELTEAAQVSVTLKDVEWRPALQSILDCYNYELYQKVAGSNVYSIRRRPPGTPEPQVVETFVLHYATVANAAVLIRSLLPEDAKISEFASRNMLVVKSTESSLGEVRTVLEAIDIVRQQVYIESKFMELTADAQKDLGIDWQALKAYSAGVGTTSKTYERNDSTTKTDTRLTDANGARYEEGSGYANNGQRVPGSGMFNLEGVTPTAENISTLATSKILTSVLDADEFRLVLSALEENKGANIVSNPKIIVANEEPANISIIRKEPNLKQERQQALNDTPDTITFTLDPDQPFFEYGIKLDVVPSINTSSNITVAINPSLTRKFGDKQAGQNTYPIIDEKTIETVFNLASGQTAAIGGLTEVSDGEVERKVPVLGSIPYLGRLFSWKQTIHGQKETVIFVTVGLANTQNIDEEIGMPEDSELARRRLIKDRNKKTLRSQNRQFYQAEDDDYLEDALKSMHQKEDARQQRRAEALRKEEEKAAIEAAKQAV